MAVVYELSTIKDIFDKVPSERIDVCLLELAILIKQAQAVRQLVQTAAADLLESNDGDASFIFPESCEWTDDGKGEIELSLNGDLSLKTQINH